MDDLACDVRRRVSENSGLHSERQRADGDITHSFDRAAERRIVKTLKRSGLNIRVLSEESEEIVLGTGEDYVAIVDPVDGSDMVARGYPLASIAVCIVELETMMPCLSQVREIFTGAHYAALDGVAKRNGRIMKPSSIDRVSDAFIVAYAATPTRRSKVEALKIFAGPFRMFLNYGGPLDVAKVGSGQCDAVVENMKGFHPRDLAAGYHIASCAGASAIDLDSRGKLVVDIADSARTKFVVAANDTLLKNIVSYLDAATEAE